MYRIALLCFGWSLFGNVNARVQLGGKSQKALEEAAGGLMGVSNPAAKTKANSNSIPRSTHPQMSDIDLLSEYGYHWCPEWSGGGWCPEGYLCGDRNNGCEWNTCCNDDPYLISCPSSNPLSEEVMTPCGANNVPDGDSAVGNYMCCDITEICGDGEECTNHCPKGECCPFTPSDVPSTCYPDDQEEYLAEESCPEGVSFECCESHWEFDEKNPAVDMAWADFTVCNQPCRDFYNLDVDVETQTLTTHCNYCLGMFEYICHREQGSICAITFSWDMYLEVLDVDEVTYEVVANYSGMYTIHQIDYECLAEECDTIANEEAIATLRFREVLASVDTRLYANLNHQFTCNQIPHIGHLIPVGFNATKECPEICPYSCPDGDICVPCETCEECPPPASECECPLCNSCCPQCPAQQQCPSCDVAAVVYEEEYETSEKVIGTIIIDRSMADFGYEKNTIAELLIDDFNRALDLARRRINILSIVEGSIIATFEILPASDSSLVGSPNEIYDEIEKRVQGGDWKNNGQLQLLSNAEHVGCVSACGPKDEGLNAATLAIAIVIPIVFVMVILAMVVYCCLKRHKEPRPSSIMDDTDDPHHIPMGNTRGSNFD